MIRLSLTSHPLSAPHAQGWAASLVLHTIVVSAAMVTLADVTLIPEQEPFKWEVSIVQAEAVQASEEAAASPTPPLGPSEPRAVAADSPPVKPEPVTPAPAIEPIREEVRPVAELLKPVQEAPRVASRPAEPPAPEPIAAPLTARKLEQPVHQTEPISQPKPVMPAEPVAAAVAAAEPPPVPNSVIEAPAQTPAQPAASVAMFKPSTSGPDRAPADYGWLAQSLWKRVVELKQYPHRARLNHWEGKVVLRAVIRHDGHLEDLTLQDSSGYEELDEAAMELVREACPLHMTRPLGRPQVVVQVPITYALR